MLILSGETRIRDLGIRTWENAAQFIDVPLLSVKDISLDLDKRKIEISSVATEKRQTHYSTIEGRAINFASLLELSLVAPTRETAAKESSAAPWIVALQLFLLGARLYRCHGGSQPRRAFRSNRLSDQIWKPKIFPLKKMQRERSRFPFALITGDLHRSTAISYWYLLPPPASPAILVPPPVYSFSNRILPEET